MMKKQYQVGPNLPSVLRTFSTFISPNLSAQPKLTVSFRIILLVRYALQIQNPKATLLGLLQNL